MTGSLSLLGTALSKVFLLSGSVVALPGHAPNEDRYQEYADARLELLPSEVSADLRMLVREMLSYAGQDRPEIGAVVNRTEELAELLPAPGRRARPQEQANVLWAPRGRRRTAAQLPLPRHGGGGGAAGDDERGAGQGRSRRHHVPYHPAVKPRLWA